MQKSSSYLFANLGKKWKNPTLCACFFVLSGQNLLPPLEIVIIAKTKCSKIQNQTRLFDLKGQSKRNATRI